MHMWERVSVCCGGDIQGTVVYTKSKSSIFLIDLYNEAGSSYWAPSTTLNSTLLSKSLQSSSWDLCQEQKNCLQIGRVFFFSLIVWYVPFIFRWHPLHKSLCLDEIFLISSPIALPPTRQMSTNDYQSCSGADLFSRLQNCGSRCIRV